MGCELSTPLLVIHQCKFKSQVRAILLRSQVHNIEFSPSVVTTKSRQNDNGVSKELDEMSIKEQSCLSAVDSHQLFFNTSHIIGQLDIWGYAASVFHRKHSVYASDSAKTSWGKIEWVFFAFLPFSCLLCENTHFPRGSAIRGKKCAHQGRIIDSRDRAYNFINTGETSAEMISGSIL